MCFPVGMVERDVPISSYQILCTMNQSIVRMVDVVILQNTIHRGKGVSFTDYVPEPQIPCVLHSFIDSKNSAKDSLDRVVIRRNLLANRT
ncbi:hypothetical protein GLYMA_02G183200v4 [Glycine max]|uniref:Uncharacterized protein n=1 Tax=Glycine max TaxID=3847 RepID=A0A0R0L8P4_SOYBN|nr:hypothetical protein JHK86_004638 [Glycine max]KAH1060946.1 hypothetical protein GYH30_004435 [Glycine max]KRH71983.1 hypothetical protein GLYMA_02G183200v4 [Glycine max]